MTGPISNGGLQQATNTTISKVPGLVVPLAATVATGYAFWRISDSFHGALDRINQKATEIREENDVEYSQYGWGHWSGNPGLDNLAHKWFGFKQFGPFGLTEKFQVMGLWASSIWHDVIQPNALEIGLAIASLYGALGPRRMHAPIRGFVNWCKKTSIPPTLKREIVQVTKQGLKGLGRGIEHLVTWPFQSLPKLGIATGALFLIALFLKRFNDSYGHDGQRNFFRNEIYDKHGVD